MYSLSQLKRGLSTPALFLREVNRLYHRRLNGRDYNTDGVDIFAEDWDVLAILDACRYDLFAERVDLPGQLEARESRGSSTVEFLRGNVDGRDLLDTVYVTANPKLAEHAEEIEAQFHAVVDVWRDGWDDAHSTVLPETVTEAAIDAATTYPNKRLLVHYVQPHYPFIATDADPFEADQAFMRPDEPGSWHRRLTGDVDARREDIWAAYAANLDRAVPAVADLMSAIEGKHVVTSDHGNMVGERARPVPTREWGHPRGLYTKELVRVPWLVHETGERRSVRADSPVASDRSPDGDGVVDQRLRDLGYAE